MKIWLFIAIACSSLYGPAQNNTADSLRRLLKKHTKNDTVRIRLLNDLAWETSYSDPREAIAISHQARSLSSRLKFPSGEAEACNELGNSYRTLNVFDSAFYHLFRALDIRNQQADSARIAAVNINIANVYVQQLKYSDAIVRYNQAIALAKRIGYKKASLVALTNLADVYRSVGMSEKAFSTMHAALDINRELKDKAQEPYLYTVLATLLHEMGNTGQAIAYNRKALAMLERNSDLMLMNSVLVNMASQYKHLEKPDSALVFYQRAAQLQATMNDSVGLGITWAGMANLYRDRRQYDLALAFAAKALQAASATNDSALLGNALLISAEVFADKGEYRQALAYALKAQPTILSANRNMQLYEMYETLSRIYNGLGQHDRRSEALEKVIQYRDSVLSAENRRFSSRLSVEMDVYGKQREIELLNKNAQIREAELSRQKTVQYFITGIAALFGMIVLVIVFFYVRIRKSNRIISKQKERVQAQNDIILSQKKIVEEKQREIIDSINYAKRIQGAVLTGEDVWGRITKEHFIVFLPKDIVSGDFYWAYNTPNSRSVFALADCTGHGVPGAFMSMLGNSFLNEIVIENKIFSASAILNKLREKIIAAMDQKGEEQRRDGMDMALCVWNRLNNTLEFSGANNALWLVREGKLQEFRGDKMPVGIYAGEKKPFSSITIQLQPGDCLYMSTDGYPDQFGGIKGKKFKSKSLQAMLLSLAGRPMAEQAEILRQNFVDWKKDHEQIDDVTVIGLRV